MVQNGDLTVLNQRMYDNSQSQLSADPNKKRAMTQERLTKPMTQSANTTMLGMNNFTSEAPLNPADYISEDFL